MQQTAPNTLLTLRESARALRDQAESFISELDVAISESPRDLEAVLDRVKNEVLASLASDSVRSDREIRTTGSPCPKCDKVLKNDVGLAIHMGREHSKKARAAKARKTTVTTPAEVTATSEG